MPVLVPWILLLGVRRLRRAEDDDDDEVKEVKQGGSVMTVASWFRDFVFVLFVFFLLSSIEIEKAAIDLYIPFLFVIN